jgi:chromosome segregation ATPase
MSILKNLKDLFIVPGDDVKQPVTNTGGTKSAPVRPNPVIATTPSSDSSGKLNDKFVTVLFDAINKANQEGFDYLEFRNSLQSLKEMPMDEATRFQSAYAMAKTMGANAATLVASAQYYLNVLSQEKQKFGEALSNQQNQQIEQKKAELSSYVENIKNKEAQIKALQTEIETLKQQATAINQEVQAAAQHIENTKNDFDVSYTYIVQQIQHDAELMQQNLK